MNLEQVKALKAGDKIRFKPGTPWGCHETRIVTANIGGCRAVHYLGHLSSPGSAEFPNALAWESFTWRDVEKVEEPASVGLDRPEQPIPIGANGMEDKHVDVPAPAPAESILAEATRITDGARARDYGSAKTNHQRIALFNACWDIAAYGSDTEIEDALRAVRLSTVEGLAKPVDDEEDAAVKMILMKIARHANTPKRDNLVDIAGYARCLSRINGFEE